MCQFDKDVVEDLRLIKLDLLSVRGLAADLGDEGGARPPEHPAGRRRGLPDARGGADHRLFPGREPGHDEPPPPDEAEGRLRADPGPGPRPAGADRKRHEGGPAPGPGGEARGARPLPREGPARDGRHPALRGAGHADRRAGGRHAARGRRPPPAELPEEGRRPAASGTGSSARRRSAATRRARWTSSGRPWRSSPPTPSTRPTAPPTPPWPTRPSTSRSTTPCPTSRPCSTPAAATTTSRNTSRRPSGRGSPILGPDANRSGRGFAVEGGAIRVGFGSVKGLGLKAVAKILEERAEGGEFPSVEDFLRRVPLAEERAPGAHPGRRLRRARAAPDAPGPALFPGARGHGPGGGHRRRGEGADARTIRSASARRAIRSPSTAGKRPAAPHPGPRGPGRDGRRARGAGGGRPADPAQGREPVFLPVRGRDGAPRGHRGDEGPELRHASRLLSERRGAQRRRRPSRSTIAVS